MKKTLAALTATALIAGSALSGSAVARDRSDRDQRSDRLDRSERADRDRDDLTTNQIIDRFAARTARIKADLRLTPEQDKHWAGFASAMDDLAKRVADRRTARREEADRRNEAARQDITQRDSTQRDDARQAEARQGDVRQGDVRSSETRQGDVRSTEVRKEVRGERRDRAASVDILERMRQDAAVMSEHAADRKALADAAQPLYDSLDEQQRRRFAEEMTNMNRRSDRD